MADNLKITEQNIDTAIDPNAGFGGILAQDHNDVLKELLKKVGKYTGAPYLSQAESNNGVIPVGVLVWNNNAMNNTNSFEITVAKKTADLNDIGILLDTMIEGSIIHFKDYVGRSVYLEYLSHKSGKDTIDGDIYNITVKGKVDNTNYTYQTDEKEVCVIEFYNKTEVKEGDKDWLKIKTDEIPNDIKDSIYSLSDVYVGDFDPEKDGVSNTGNLQVDGVATVKDKFFAGNRHSSWGVTIKSDPSQNGAINLEARGNDVKNPGFNFFQQGNFAWVFWNYLSQQLLRMTANLVEIFKPLKLLNVPTGSTSDQYLSIDTSGNVRKVVPDLGGPYAFKQNGSGYYEIKIPYGGTNFSIKFAVYRHGNGLDEYHVSGYLNNPNGWVQTHVKKISQSGNATETITLTDNGSASDFRIYIGDNGSTGRNITTLFITQAILSGISGGSSSIGALSVFPISIQSSITGVVKGTF
ncbi:hypothetical protein [Tenacibaculum sp. C7A-26P2]|uniref:hypothetical protein n=1 Tax=Tenacibaculum sp. C7A-26P2 TaxID=3447504 RepID=UPI003F85F7C3